MLSTYRVQRTAGITEVQIRDGVGTGQEPKKKLQEANNILGCLRIEPVVTCESSSLAPSCDHMCEYSDK